MANSPTETTNWVTQAAQFFGASGLGVALWKFGMRVYTDLLQTRAIKTLKNMAIIYDALQVLLSELKGARSLILYVSNGGGIPEPGKAVYGSILYEAKTPDLKPIRQNWLDVLVDEGYIHMLNQVIVNGKFSGEPNLLRPGVLKELYEAEGVVFFAIYPVLKTKSRFYFLSLRWYDINLVPTVGKIDITMLTVANTIAQILRGKARPESTKNILKELKNEN
jgi:hypothetical protein